jgi:hypothetical protein
MGKVNLFDEIGFEIGIFHSKIKRLFHFAPCFMRPYFPLHVVVVCSSRRAQINDEFVLYTHKDHQAFYMFL